MLYSVDYGVHARRCTHPTNGVQRTESRERSDLRRACDGVAQLALLKLLRTRCPSPGMQGVIRYGILREVLPEAPFSMAAWSHEQQHAGERERHNVLTRERRPSFSGAGRGKRTKSTGGQRPAAEHLSADVVGAVGRREQQGGRASAARLCPGGAPGGAVARRRGRGQPGLLSSSPSSFHSSSRFET